MKNLKASIILGLCFLLPVLGQAHRVGNGGDFVRATFMIAGDQVIKLIQQRPDVLEQLKVTTDDLQLSLDYNRIDISLAPLIDNSGSFVDAIGVPGKITLDQQAWAGHFDARRDIYFLVFHEMLRSLAIDDDNYLISKNIFPFPQELKVDTALNLALPLEGAKQMGEIIDSENVQLKGNGCDSGLGNVFFDLDLQQKVIRITPKAMDLASQTKKTVRKTCNMAIPLKGIAGKKLQIVMVDAYLKSDLEKADNMKLSLQLFKAGESNDINLAKQVTVSGPSRDLVRSQVLFESQCGEMTNLRMNLATTLKNSSLNSHGTLEKVEIYLDLADCGF